MPDTDKHGRRILDIHPDDAIARRTLLAELFSLRAVSRVELADRLGIAPRAVWGFEKKPSGNRELDAVQRYARAVDHRLVMHLTDLPGARPEDEALLELLAGLAEHHDPQRADTNYLAYVAAWLASVRAAAGVSRTALAEVIGCTDTSVEAVERGRTSPFLSTYQRHARAIGIAAGYPAGRLDLSLEPVHAPVLAEVA